MNKLLPLLFFAFVCLGNNSYSQSNDDEIVKNIISDSISRYSGNCPCPYSAAKNGSSCGKRSAYSRASGYSPLCYSSDVTHEKIVAWKNTHAVKSSINKINGNANVLQSGASSLLYRREDWKHWIDLDGDCQDTRAEMLIQSSLIDVEYRNKNNCSVVKGKWLDVYTGKTWINASDLDIDHVVPLSWANGHGGSSWPKEKKREFANDIENLLPVEDNINQEKSDKGLDEWLPPKNEYRCEYIKKFDELVVKYNLLYAPSENRVARKLKTACKLI